MLIPLSAEGVVAAMSKPGENSMVLAIDDRVPVVALVKALTAAGLVIRTTDFGLMAMRFDDWADDEHGTALVSTSQLNLGFGPR